MTPTPAQIEQFKSLSPSEQKALAERAGIDISSFTGQSTGNQPDLSEPESPPRAQASQPQATPAKDTTLSDSETADSDELKLFGSELFNTSLESFRPAVSVPVPADYVIGPGDSLVIQLYGKENASHQLVVNREGQVQFPQIGPVTLAGLTFSKVQEAIEEIVSEQKIGVRASVTMGALRSIRIFVLGDVNNPGSFTVGALSTLTNALFESGGITPVGSLRNIQLKRNGKTVTTFDLYDLLLKGDTSQDTRLLPGDVIFVPPIGQTAGISGDVKRPAIYELKNDIATRDLIALAGGIKNTAHLPQSQIIRINAEGEKNIINLDLTKSANKGFKLHDGDRLSIPSTLEFVNNQIELQGHVKRTGMRSWRQGLRFTDLVPTPNVLLPNPDIDIALIQRHEPDTLETSAFTFSPRDAWANPGSSQDPLLQPNDIIQLFDYESDRTEQLAELTEQLATQADFHERNQTVAISGSVRFPGAYPLTPDMTSKTLIALAGGLLESAMGTRGEITRYTIGENRQRIVSHIPVDFTDTPVHLEPADTLQVKQIPLWKEKETVEIKGEVMFPGSYTILPGETLTNLLERAGGMTPQAYPLGAIFSRKELRELEAERISELKDKLQSEVAASSAMIEDDSQKLDPAEVDAILKNLDSLKPLGRMVINLPKVIADPDNADFELEDGDTLTIPRYKPSVTVVGEVQYPTSHFFEKSYDAYTYIERSGGFKKHADEGRVYIVKANGLVVQPPKSRWFRADSTAILPGDTIVVPLDTDRVDKLDIWASVTSIMYQAALGVTAIIAL